MSGNRGVVITLGAALALAGGGLFYFFKIHQPKQQRGAAQEEIIGWETRLAAAHTCLFGDKPASVKPGEALAVRELAPDPWDRASCTKLVGKLSRGLADDTGLMKIEHAWMTVDRAAAKVANAFASHVDPSGDAFDKRRDDSPLPAALDELEAARADLRAAAGMEPYAGRGTASLPAAETIALKDGNDRVSTLSAWLLPSAGGVVAFGSVKDKGEVQLTLVPGAAPKQSKLPPGTVRAVPGLAWGAAGLREQVAIGPIDDAGAFGAMTSLPVEMGARVVIDVGTLTNGLVAYAASNHLVIARSTGGAFVADKPIEVGRITEAIDATGRALVAWSTPDDGPLRGFIATDGAPPKIVELGAGFPQQSCLTSTHGWIAASDQLVAFDATGATPHVLPEHELLACTHEAALLHRFGSTHYTVCSDTCRGADLAGLRSTNVATIAGGKVHAIRTRNRVLGVWTEGAPPRFFTLEKALTPTLATSNGKVIDVLGETADGVVVVRVPI